MFVKGSRSDWTINFEAVASALAVEFTGKVVGVSDGDTIKVLHNGKAEKIEVMLKSVEFGMSGSPVEYSMVGRTKGATKS